MGYRRFGILLGTGLGVLSVLLDLMILGLMGHPDVLIRLGWEGPAVAFCTVAGWCVGLLYARILRGLIQPEQLQANTVAILVSTIVVAAGLYAVGDLISVKRLDALAWYATRILGLFVPLVIAKVLCGRPKGKGSSI